MTHIGLRRGAWIAAVWLTTAVAGWAQPLPVAKPESVGMSSERLGRLTTAWKALVDEGKLAGTVTLVARDGKVVHHDVTGFRDVEGQVPMTTDTLFRIASMSKAVTSTAIMMLVEEGRIHLDDPVAKFIPAFAKPMVVVPPGPGAPASRAGTVPANRPITIRHLLTHTSGLSYGHGNAFEASYRDAKVLGWYFADKAEPIATTIDRLAALPLDSHPGEKYVYGFSTDVLGVVVEKASGLSLADFFQTRIFTPLKMTSTSFYVDPAQAGRLATVYSLQDSSPRITRGPAPGTGQGNYVEGPRQSFSGGAGLVSTAGDYARFLQMLLNGGVLDGARLLSPKTVELMTSNHVGDLYSNGNFGFGLGFEITEHVGRSGRVGSVGEYGWGGAYHTKFWVDPVEKLVVVFMTQLLPATGSTAQTTLRQLVYSAIVESPGASAKVALRPAS